MDSIKENIKIFLIILKDLTTDLFENIKLIFSFKKILLLILTTPFIYYTIKIQIIISMIFFLYFFLVFFCLFFLKSPFLLQCKEVYLNPEFIERYAFFNVFIQIPRSYAYYTFYNILHFIVNNKKFKHNKLNFFDFVGFTFLFFIVYIYKFSFFLLLGYSYLSINITINLIIMIERLLSYEYENNKALYQTLILNCLIINNNIISKTEDLKIYYNKDDELEFNMFGFFKKFFKNVKSSELLKDVYYNKPQDTDVIYCNNHFTAIQKSLKYKEKNIATNYTSNKTLIIKNEKNIKEEIILTDGKKPNFIGQNKDNYFKDNYLTPPHTIDEKTSIIKEFPTKYIYKANTLKSDANIHLLKNADNKIYYSEKGEILKKENSPTLKEYSKETELPIYKKIEQIQKFEKINEEYLNTKDGKEQYDLFKKAAGYFFEK